MKVKSSYVMVLVILITNACSLTNGPLTPPPIPITTHTLTGLPSTEVFTPIPTLTNTPFPFPTETVTPTPLPVVERLKARVAADLLSCRYGPGPEYLYLFALRRGANIELVGRVDMLEWDPGVSHWKARHLDLSPVLTPARKPHPNVGTYCQVPQKHGLEQTLDQMLLIPECRASYSGETCSSYGCSAGVSSV